MTPPTIPMTVTFPGEPHRTLTEAITAVINGEAEEQPNPTMSWWGGFTTIPGTTTTAQELQGIVNETYAKYYGPFFFRCPIELAAMNLPGNPLGPKFPK